MSRSLGSHTNLTLPVQTTAPALDILPESYGRMEGSVLINGFNTRYGSCVPTGVLNYIRAQYARAGRTDTITDQLALDLYTAVTGFNQNDPTTDKGTDPEAMLTYFKENKIAEATLNNFVRIDHTNETALRNSIVKTGSVLLIFELSQDQENQTEWVPTEGPTSVPGSWGGHCTDSPSYSGAAYYVITWGEILSADRSYINANGYLVGAYELDITLDPEPAQLTTVKTDSTDQMILARTIWAEAHGDGLEGMQAVASVICNRARNPSWWGHSIYSVCLAPWQFSCWNINNDPNSDHQKMLHVEINDPDFAIAVNLAGHAVNGILPDNTLGSDSYYALSIPAPKWVDESKFKIQIGSQKFYRIQLPVN